MDDGTHGCIIESKFWISANLLFHHHFLGWIMKNWIKLDEKDEINEFERSWNGANDKYIRMCEKYGRKLLSMQI